MVIILRGLVDANGQIGGGPIMGLIARNYSIPAGLITSAFLLSPALLLLWTIYMKKIDGGSSSLILPNQSG